MSEETTPTGEPQGALERFRALPLDSLPKTIAVALTLCLVCSVAVSGVAIALRERQELNRENDRKKVILQVAGLYEANEPIETLFEQVETRVVDLETGEYVDEPGFDQRAAATDPAQSIAIPADEDIAKIKRRAKHASVYLVKDGDQVRLMILPVHGYGLWSTLYGFVALEADANTIYGVQFYEHAETAGLGDRIVDPAWVGQFHGKHAYDDSGQPRIRTVKGGVVAGSPDAQYEVDGIVGATLTADAVTGLLHYWLGDQGFRPYLQKLGS